MAAKTKKEAAPEAEAGPVPVPRLQERYHQELLPALAKSLDRVSDPFILELRKLVTHRLANEFGYGSVTSPVDEFLHPLELSHVSADHGLSHRGCHEWRVGFG